MHAISNYAFMARHAESESGRTYWHGKVRDLYLASRPVTAKTRKR